MKKPPKRLVIKPRLPPVHTVGEMLKQLKKFPPDMRILIGCSDFIRFTSARVNLEAERRLHIEEVDLYDEE